MSVEAELMRPMTDLVTEDAKPTPQPDSTSTSRGTVEPTVLQPKSPDTENIPVVTLTGKQLAEILGTYTQMKRESLQESDPKKAYDLGRVVGGAESILDLIARLTENEPLKMAIKEAEAKAHDKHTTTQGVQPHHIAAINKVK